MPETTCSALTPGTLLRLTGSIADGDSSMPTTPVFG